MNARNMGIWEGGYMTREEKGWDMERVKERE
jgi:hypothetical protein